MPIARDHWPSLQRGLRSSAPAGLRRGFILLSVLVLVMLISMIAVSLLFQIQVEDTAAAAGAGAEQAWAAAWSGVQAAMRVAAAAPAGASDWEDDPGAFRSRFVFDDGAEQWFFTIYSPTASDSLTELRFGLTDEAGKINLNQRAHADFGRLGRLTPAHVAALRDFLQSGGAPPPDAATRDFEDALLLPEPAPRGSFAATDQLLLVPGFTPEFVFGEDANQNFRLDPNENDGNERFPADNNDSKLDAGVRPFFTVVSSTPNRSNSGAPRVNINDPAAPLPAAEWPPGFTNYIAALRAAQTPLAHSAELLEATLQTKNEQGQPVTLASGVGKAELPLVLDLLTTSRTNHEAGLININTASIAVLATVPGIDEPLAESIVSTRRSISPERRTTIAWLFQEGVVDAIAFKRLAPHLTARSGPFSFHVVGFSLPSGRFRVLEVIIDVAGFEPRIVYLRDLTRLGMPFKLEADKVDSPVARSGQRREASQG